MALGGTRGASFDAFTLNDQIFENETADLQLSRIFRSFTIELDLVEL